MDATTSIKSRRPLTKPPGSFTKRKAIVNSIAQEDSEPAAEEADEEQQAADQLQRGGREREGDRQGEAGGQAPPYFIFTSS